MTAPRVVACVLCAVLAGCVVEDIVALPTLDAVPGVCACDGVVGAGALTIDADVGDLLSGGAIEGMLDLDVAANAQVAGAVSANDLTVDGVLRTTVDAPVVVTGIDAAPRRVVGPVDVRAVCDCDEGTQLDIAAMVQSARADNDNGAIGLDPLSLQNAQSSNVLTLPCGRFYVESIGGAGDIQLVVTGHAALFVGTDIALTRSLTVMVQAGALDLVVAGNITIADALAAGDDATQVRIYVGGDGTLDLSGSAELGGVLYAPGAELVARGSLRVWGPVFVRRLSAQGDITVRHTNASTIPVAPACP